MPEFTTTTEVEIEFDVECDECGEGLKVEASGPNEWNGKHQIDVVPCRTCLAKAVKDALAQAKDERSQSDEGSKTDSGRPSPGRR